tara:strand:+ start:23012 stop:23773 length:762 start_codon:yes stop_codon:yes gene_type:complete
MIETHCHLDYLKDRPLEETLELSRQAGVSTFITIGVSPKNLDTVFEISKAHQEIYFTQGIHPHDAKLYTDEVEELIKARTTEPKMVAVGEIGLDYHYDNSPRDIQCQVFERQLNIAIASNKPVVIHTRDADDDTAEILKKLAPKLARKGVVHSFTSSKELAQSVLDLGFYIGINGIITFKNAENVRDIVRLTPLERMLIETDSPFLAPVPNRGRENAPFNLPHIVKKIAEIKEVSEEEVVEITTKNAKELFLL